jgi:inner membrane protein
MDTLTHALSGALLVRATLTDGPAPQAPSRRARLVAGALAAAFPDGDVVLRAFDILIYLNWHQGVTHSLILLPLWAWLLAQVFARINRHARDWRGYYGACALGIGAHIAGDLITNYGVILFAPLSTWRVSLPTTFLIDLYFSAIIVLGLLASWRWRTSRRPAVLALSVLVGYVAFQALLRQQALDIALAYARDNGLVGSEVQALAQPLSPFNWKLLVSEDDIHHVAQVNLLRTDISATPPRADAGFVSVLAASYHAPDGLVWARHARFGGNPSDYALARAAWEDDALMEFRRFAAFPALYGVESNAHSECVSFVDLRFVLAGLAPPFRFAACRVPPHGPWTLERLS